MRMTNIGTQYGDTIWYVCCQLDIRNVQSNTRCVDMAERGNLIHLSLQGELVHCLTRMSNSRWEDVKAQPKNEFGPKLGRCLQ